jgi:hypothetical protein
MKRTLIVIAGAVVALGTNLALAQDQFSDAYWKELNTVRSVQSTSPIGAPADYGFVDRNPAQ